MRLSSVLALLCVAGLTGAAWPAARAQQIAHAASVLTELDSTTQAAVSRELSLARARGLPVEPLVAKVREGRIKRAPGTRIRSAVAALSVRLDSARAALGPDANAAELIAGADALAAGVNGAALRTVRSASGPRDVAAHLGVLAQLVLTGVSPRRATADIVELIRRDAPGRHVLDFGNAVERDVAAGVPADEAAPFRLRAIEATSLRAGDLTTVTAAPVRGNTGTGDSFTNNGSPRPKRKP